MQTIDAVLFDMDGTLIDSRATIVATYRAAARSALGQEFPPAGDSVERLLQMRAQEAFDLVAGGEPARAKSLATEFQRVYADHESTIPWFPGAIDALRELMESGVTLGVVTTKARQRLDLHLASGGARDLFDVTIAGDESPRQKPDPLPILMALERIAVMPERSLFVGDGPNDVVAAKAAGAGAVGVSYGFHPDECRAADPDHWIDSLPELARLVHQLRSHHLEEPISG